ncbi:hypothetical protein HaLaN_29079 [Haematococcus lacustris]|uniref:Uncharacterized protein n=1 Tax=Haematococcus lacustris TaxID=44745 RepID=A0A6A0ADA7_HAELA|nr:hypothetical protein HaLaN_29079 [Haematococcus lacustris]
MPQVLHPCTALQLGRDRCDMTGSVVKRIMRQVSTITHLGTPSVKRGCTHMHVGWHLSTWALSPAMPLASSSLVAKLNEHRHITFTRAANVTVCPVNAIGSFLLTEAFFCVEKTTRTTAACWACMASYYTKMKRQFNIISDKVLHAFRKGAAFNLFNQGAQSELIKSVGNWKNDVMMTAYTTGAAPSILIQQGGWRHIDNDYLQGYFNERFLIKVCYSGL